MTPSSPITTLTPQKPFLKKLKQCTRSRNKKTNVTNLGFIVARNKQTQDVSPAAQVSVIVRESRSLWGSQCVCRRNIGVALPVPWWHLTPRDCRVPVGDTPDVIAWKIITKLRLVAVNFNSQLRRHPSASDYNVMQQTYRGNRFFVIEFGFYNLIECSSEPMTDSPIWRLGPIDRGERNLLVIKQT